MTTTTTPTAPGTDSPANDPQPPAIIDGPQDDQPAAPDTPGTAPQPDATSGPDDAEAVKVTPFRPIFLPVAPFLAACKVASKDEQRTHINGVWLLPADRKAGLIDIAATDGHRLVVSRVRPFDDQGNDLWPEFFEDEGLQGVLLSPTQLAARLRMATDDLYTGTVAFHYEHADDIMATLRDYRSYVVFRHDVSTAVSPPSFQGVIDQAFAMIENEDKGNHVFSQIGIRAQYWKDMGDLAKMLSADSDSAKDPMVRLFKPTNPGQPMCFTFGRQGSVAVQMPATISQSLDDRTRDMLAAPVRRTLAALRAHKTRWTAVLEDDNASAEEKAEAQAKADGFAERIAEVEQNAVRQKQVEDKSKSDAPDEPAEAEASTDSDSQADAGEPSEPDKEPEAPADGDQPTEPQPEDDKPAQEAPTADPGEPDTAPEAAKEPDKEPVEQPEGDKPKDDDQKQTEQPKSKSARKRGRKSSQADRPNRRQQAKKPTNEAGASA